MAAPGTPEWHDQVARERQLRDAQFRAQQDAFNRAQRERNEAARVTREANAEKSRQMMCGMIGMPGSGSSYRMGQALAGRDYDGKLISEKYQQVQPSKPYSPRPLTAEEIKKHLVSRTHKELRNICLDPYFRDRAINIGDKAKQKLAEFCIRTRQLGLYRKESGVGDVFDRLIALALDSNCKERLARLSTNELKGMLSTLEPFKVTPAEIASGYTKRTFQHALRFIAWVSLGFFNCLTLWFILSILASLFSLVVVSEAVHNISYHKEFLDLSNIHGNISRTTQYHLDGLRDTYFAIGVLVIIPIFCIGNVVRIVEFVGKPLSSMLEPRP